MIQESASIDNYEQREAYAVEAIKKNLTYNPRLVKEKSIFANLYTNPLTPDHYIFSCADTAGSKVIIATLMDKYDTIGIDVVAMNANDAATLGEIIPDMFMNCLSCQKDVDHEGITGELVKGIQLGLEMCDVSSIIPDAPRPVLGKGEKASMQDVIAGPLPNLGFDIAGSMTGFIKKSSVPDFKPRPGDEIIGIRSSGVHCNGFTTIRFRLLDGSFETRDEFRKLYTGTRKLDEDFNGINLGDELLKPTKLYVKLMADIAVKYPGSFGVNITGNGLKNFNRIGSNIRYLIDDPFKPQPIFELIQEESGLTDKQMYEKFNMGMGFAVIAKKENSQDILNLAKKHGEEAKIVGKITKGNNGNETVLENKNIAFRGY